MATTKTLIPQAFWFQFAFRCPRVDAMPVQGDDSRIVELPDACRLQSLAPLDGKTPWVEVRSGWNPKGLGLVFSTQGFGKQPLDLSRPDGFATVVVLIDTRDTRDISRASRHCHRFVVQLVVRQDRRLEVQVGQATIARSTGDPPMAKRDTVTARAALAIEGWRLELFFQPEALHGFDPDTNRRLGFAYRVADHAREDQFLGVGRDFPIEENPSLWSTLELVD